MHDTSFFEEQGVPAVALVSDQFASQAQYQGESLAVAGCRRVFLCHPFSDQTDAQLENKADAAFRDIVDALVAADFVNGMPERSMQATDAATCSDGS